MSSMGNVTVAEGSKPADRTICQQAAKNNGRTARMDRLGIADTRDQHCRFERQNL